MDKICVSCRKPRVDSVCGICEGDVCRKCRIFLSEEEFPYVQNRPEELKHSYYCGACYDAHVEPFRAEYESTVEQAKQVNVLYTNTKSTFRILKKADEAIEVSNSTDRDEAILKLAFEAAREGYNALIDVEVSSQKVRNEGYQKSTWTARGLPAEIKSHEMKF